MTDSSPSARLETHFTVPLDRLSQDDLERAGGKAANLGELFQGGFPVPQGFAVTTAAYDAFVSHHGLRETIEQALPDRSGRGEKIRGAFLVAPIPVEVEQAVLAAYRQLGEGPVAVRSSATAEDLPGASFAGQQDTFLNIVGGEALVEAVRKCWASLWTDRAIAYRDSQGIDQHTVRLAVVVQSMVAAESAGVMFTANPVTGARNETVIDANPGLGEAVVSGLATPDHYVLRRGRWGWQIAARQAGQREVVIQALPGGGTRHLTGKDAIGLAALPDAALRRLARLGAAIQRHFGAPQDIEWAWAGGKPYILQSRPITALPAPPPSANQLKQLLTNNFVEMLPIRPYPLDLDTWMVALGNAVEPVFSLLGLDWSLDELFEAEDGVVIRYELHFPRPTWKILLAPARLLINFLRYKPTEWRADPVLVEAIARARSLEQRDVQALSWGQLLRMVYEARDLPLYMAGDIRRRYFPSAAFAAVRLRLLLSLMGQAGKLGTLISSAENQTLAMNRTLEQLAQQVRSNPELETIFRQHAPEVLEAALEGHQAGRVFLEELHAFFDRYGHRETVISTALEPTWKDAPAMVLGIIKGFALHPPARNGKPDWQLERDELLRHPLLRFGPLRLTFLELLDQARVLLQIREDTHFYATLPMPIFRRVFLEMGRRLTQVGVLDAAEEVFHLRLAELEQLGKALPPPTDLATKLRRAMMRRKAERIRLEDAPLVDPRLFPARTPDGSARLHGTPGSPGVAEGQVRIVRDMTEFDRLAPGEVLVAPYTNPSWTPLFQRAAAVVVDSGSPASHAAIVAREYGIPAVMATQTGTRTLRDGERVRVDGSRGLVFDVPPAAERAGQEFETEELQKGDELR